MVSLPLLDAMMPSIAQAARLTGSTAVSPEGVARRMAFFFVPNGVNLAHWTPKQEGYGYDLPSILTPLKSLRDDVSVITGLTHDKGRANGDGAGDHARSASVFLTGAQPRKTAAGNIRSGVSVDQVAARHLGARTRFPSIELGCDQTRDSGNCDSGYSCAYSHNIAWSSSSTPVAKEIDPRLVFERLFGDGSSGKQTEAGLERMARRKSVLDYVLADANRLQNSVGSNDRRKLAEYLDAVRQIERRVEMHDAEAGRGPLAGVRPPEGIPREYVKHVRLMLDMIVLAFQTDQTRIATCMFASAGSNRSYGDIGVRDGHHDLSHHGGDAEKLDKIRRINTHHVEQFAYFLERLKAIPEGDGTLLDQCMIVYGSGISDGNRHNNENLPVLLAGKGGGTLDSGRHIRYAEETPMCNLFLSMLERMDVSVPWIGDSTGLLPSLS
ncbi:MAG: DUF1552 domain-containing protein [Planctomycetales bacterium]|nr:DUF1552 domain-containing protein [Planctomycetales bacterium]